MYKKMLVPLDGSKMAEVVFPYAREVAGRLGVDLDFLHVCTPEEADSLAMRQAYIEHMAEMVRGQSEARGHEIAPHKEKKTIKATGKAVVGYPPEEILRYADENNDDIIMVATHGRSGLKLWAMGSVSYKITHTSKKPVWLIRAGVPDEIIYDYWPTKTTLVLLDGSALAESSLPHVEALSKQRGAEIINVCLVNVCDPAHLSPLQYQRMPPGIQGIPSKWEEYEKQEHQRCRSTSDIYLKSVAERLKAAGLNVETKVLEGDPGVEIVKFAKSNPIQLIVMATYGHSGINRLVFSSTVEKVLLGGHTPIFLVPSPETPTV
jgi:nucleotide-binding universal stress UspA family protein